MTSPATQLRHWHIYPTEEQLHTAAAHAITRCADQAINEKNLFRIVLTGGRTPAAVYKALRSARSAWAAWHVYIGDERCLPEHHAERNSKMALDTWLAHVEIPRQQIHWMRGELGAEQGAVDYQEVLPAEDFDLVLLGLGEDGHIASLFPGHVWGEDADAPTVLPVHNSPKPPPDRISLSAHRLSRAHQVMFIVAGESKKAAVAKWRNGQAIPATSINPRNGVDILLDEASFPVAPS